MNKAFLIAIFMLSLFVSARSFADNKGINFQGVISTPTNQYPSVQGITVNLKILAPNECILWEERHFSVNITSGYLNLVVGKGSVGGGTPSAQTFQNVFSNSATHAGLTCLDLDGAVKPSVTTYTPALYDTRRLRVDLYINGDHVVADFNMRSLPFAINSETLAGKTESEFIQTSAQITQARLEQFFQSVTSVTGGSVRWDGSNFVSYDASSGASLSDGSVPWAKLSTVPAPLSQIGGLSCTNGQTLKVSGSTWACAASGSGSITSSDVTDFATAVDARISTSLSSLSVTGNNFSNQNANVVFSGPSSGGSAKPAFRALVIADLPGSIPDSKLDTISSSGKVANSATTATNVNTASTIVARGLSGEVATGDITAGSIASSGQIGAGLVEHSSLNTNWNSGNIQTTTAAAGTLTFTASSMKNGSNYMLILKTAGTFTLSNTGDITTWKCLPACSSRQIVATGETVLTIIKVGTTGYVSWMAGF